jgi:hypothetical protein
MVGDWDVEMPPFPALAARISLNCDAKATMAKRSNISSGSGVARSKNINTISNGFNRLIFDLGQGQ